MSGGMNFVCGTSPIMLWGKVGVERVADWLHRPDIEFRLEIKTVSPKYAGIVQRTSLLGIPWKKW